MKKFLYVIVAASLTGSLSSCLNDDEHYVDFKNVGAIAEIPSSAFYGLEDTRSYLKVAAAADTFDVKVSSPNIPSQDVQISVAIDEAALTAFNAQNDTDYKILPASLYQLTTPTVTVKAGTRLAPVSFQLNTTSLSFTDNYAIPFVIKTATNNVTVSSNYGTKILAIKLRNNYEGTYQATGRFTHPNPASSRDINKSKTLASIDETTSQTEYADLGGSGYLMWLKINADNTVTLTPRNGAPTTVQTGVNTYDPATRTFTLNYRYAGAGGDRVITEKLQRVD
ncbi:BT_3987 domain-containing protein [Spirosoma soli]|uniref:BT_3987 domain-containing protein n=1 Tax=Spirosoma soli TaxID=1770529 RepID=A0ABW5M110_9BACT